ncbi:zinc finger transcriptional activator, partial [Teratosphaeriaceae sp. CCFEE 6253]
NGMAYTPQSNQQQQQQQAMGGAMSTHQQQQQQQQPPPQWSYTNFDASNINDTNFYPNPLHGISAAAYDLTDNDFSVMPPPNYMSSPNQTTNTANNNNGMLGSGTGAYDPVYGTNTYGVPDSGPEDWLALPLDNLFGINGAVVNQTLYGPQIDGQDMLEVLLNGGVGAGGGGGGGPVQGQGQGGYQ